MERRVSEEQVRWYTLMPAGALLRAFPTTFTLWSFIGLLKISHIAMLLGRQKTRL